MIVKLSWGMYESQKGDCICIVGALHDRDPQNGVDKGPFLDSYSTCTI